MTRIIECRESGLLLVVPEDSHLWREQRPTAPPPPRPERRAVRTRQPLISLLGGFVVRGKHA